MQESKLGSCHLPGDTHNWLSTLNMYRIYVLKGSVSISHQCPNKIDIFNLQILGENDHQNHQIIHQLKVKDLLYHSVQ